jgi:pimeloyl-ACP methyl ester carboxylesterase
MRRREGALMTHYKKVSVAGLSIFHREAGDPSAPTLLLLHGFPTSSHMYRDLIPVLADRYHLVAPDLPGFGFSDAPDRARFAYTFERLTDVIERFTDAACPLSPEARPIFAGVRDSAGLGALTVLAGRR